MRCGCSEHAEIVRVPAQRAIRQLAEPSASKTRLILNIDFIITELFVGGAERCLTELAIGLTRRGDRVRVGSIGSLPTGDQAQLTDRLVGEGIELFSAGCDHWSEAVRARAMLRDWLREGRPDVAQSMLVHANIIGTMAAVAANVRVRVGGVRVAERSRVRNAIESWAMSRMSAVVCVSNSVRNFVHGAQRTNTPLHVVSNSIDLDQIEATNSVSWGSVSPSLAGGSHDVLLFVGRLHPQKGLDVLFDALPELLARHADMKVVLVGDGPLRAWVESTAATLSPERIAVVGWRRDALSLIKACRLLVLPSRFEGMPNVVMEAMAAGKPIACTRVEGVEELLGSSMSNQTCEPGNVDALRELINRLWEDPDRANSLGAQNRSLIAASYSVDKMVRRYHELYQSLMDSL